MLPTLNPVGCTCGMHSLTWYDPAQSVLQRLKFYQFSPKAFLLHMETPNVLGHEWDFFQKMSVITASLSTKEWLLYFIFVCIDTLCISNIKTAILNYFIIMLLLSYSAERFEIVFLKKPADNRWQWDSQIPLCFNIKSLDKYSNIQIKIDLFKRLLILIESERTVFNQTYICFLGMSFESGLE